MAFHRILAWIFGSAHDRLVQYAGLACNRYVSKRMRRPDYQGEGIANLMTSLVVGLGGARAVCPPAVLLEPQEIAAFHNVILLVIDGLGLDRLSVHAEAPWLQGHLRGRLTSVFPSTTASAVTTFLTGDPPQQHGLTGWHMYFRELGSVLAVLPGRPRYGGVGLSDAGVAAGSLFGHVPVFDRLDVDTHVISPAHIAQSDFSLAHLGRAQLSPYRGLDAMLTIASTLVREDGGRRFIYGYWPDLDATGHREGCASAEAYADLARIDQAMMRFAEAIEGTDTLLVVTADHGQIDTTESDRLSLDDHPDLADMLAMPLCGESRLPYCYLKPGRNADFEHYVARELAQAADAVPSAELVADGWFGPGEPHPRLLDRVGDYALLMKHHYVLKDWLPFEPRHELIGVHGGLTDEEMWVPLIVHAA